MLQSTCTAAKGIQEDVLRERQLAKEAPMLGDDAPQELRDSRTVPRTEIAEVCEVMLRPRDVEGMYAARG